MKKKISFRVFLIAVVVAAIVSAVALPLVLMVVAVVYFVTGKDEVLEFSIFVQEKDEKEE